MTLHRWCRARLRAARRSLHPFGIKGAVLRAKLVLSGFPSWWAVAYVDDDRHIYVCRSWAQQCRADHDGDEVESTLRHELVHLICNRHPDVCRRFRLPEYGGPVLLLNKLWSAFGFISYRQIHPEEALAERVGALHRGSLRALARVLRQQGRIRCPSPR